jgi:hypothetical protein
MNGRSIQEHRRSLEKDPPILVPGYIAWTGHRRVAVTMLFTQQHARNIPYMNDFMLVSVMSGHEPVNLRWTWTQHNEHRPVISRLTLSRAVPVHRQRLPRGDIL